MQDFAKLYRHRYREAEGHHAVRTVRMIRQIVRLKINPVLMITAIVALVEAGGLRE